MQDIGQNKLRAFPYNDTRFCYNDVITFQEAQIWRQA